MLWVKTNSPCHHEHANGDKMNKDFLQFSLDWLLHQMGVNW